MLFLAFSLRRLSQNACRACLEAPSGNQEKTTKFMQNTGSSLVWSKAVKKSHTLYRNAAKLMFINQSSWLEFKLLALSLEMKRRSALCVNLHQDEKNETATKHNNRASLLTCWAAWKSKSTLKWADSYNSTTTLCYHRWQQSCKYSDKEFIQVYR